MKTFLFFAFVGKNPDPAQALIITGMPDKKAAKVVALANTSHRLVNAGWTYSEESQARSRAKELCPQNIMFVNITHAEDLQ